MIDMKYFEPGDPIWLIKENEYALVLSSWKPIEELEFQFINNDGLTEVIWSKTSPVIEGSIQICRKDGKKENWMVRLDGSGHDFVPLVRYSKYDVVFDDEIKKFIRMNCDEFVRLNKYGKV